MSGTSYVIGEIARLTFEVHNGPKKTDPLIDPTTLTLRVQPPAPAVEIDLVWPSGTIVHDGLGLFHGDIPCTALGTWKWRWKATGAATTAREGAFVVQASAFPSP